MTESGDFNYFWALYPYCSAISCNGEAVTASLSDKQVAKAGSFSPNTNITLAKSLGLALSFYNVCSWMRFSVVKEGITAVTFRGKNNEDVAGTFQVSMSAGDSPRPTQPVVIDGKKSITLSAPEGETFEVGEYYYLTFFPQVFSDGISLTFETETETGTRYFNTSYTFNRSAFKTATRADNTITYLPKSAPTAIPIAVSAGGGNIILPDTDGAVLLDFSNVKDGSSYHIQYSAAYGARHPGHVYVAGKADTSVGTLSGSLPETTVSLLSGTYAATELTTALNTLIIEIGVQVGTVTVSGGGLTVNGTVTTLNVHEDAAASDDEPDKIIIVINNAVSVINVQETNCSIQIASGGQVESIDTQSGNTTIESGATVSSVSVSGTGTLNVQSGATVDNISATGDVDVTVSGDAKTSSGDVPAMFEATIGDGTVVPASGVQALSVNVISNVSWTFSIPDSHAGWIRMSDGKSTQSGNGNKVFTLQIDKNSGSLSRQAILPFTYGSVQSAYTLCQSAAGGITGGIDDWEDGGGAEFGKK